MKIGWFKKREGEALAPWLPEELIPHLAKDPHVIAAVFRNLDDEETENWALAARIAKENREKEGI